jgi:Mg2+ and Co2+ transporter CorA
MVSIFHFLNGEIKKLTIKEFSQACRQPDGVMWIDLDDPSDAEEETLLVSLLDIHPLAIEDTQRGMIEEEGRLSVHHLQSD